MSKGTRTNIYLSDEMREAINRVAYANNSNFSATVRLMISEWLLEKRGVKVDYRLEWGGKREATED